MSITLSQTNEAFRIENNADIGIYENNSSGISVNPLTISSTGMMNYVPYITSSDVSANPTTLSQIGGVVIQTGTNTVSSTNVTTPFNNVNIQLTQGTYCLVGSVDISSASTASVTSWGVFFDTSSNLSSAATNGNAYSISRNYVLNASTGLPTVLRIQKQAILVVNLANSTTIYLNYYMKSTAAFTAYSTIVATRLG